MQQRVAVGTKRKKTARSGKRLFFEIKIKAGSAMALPFYFTLSVNTLTGSFAFLIKDVGKKSLLVNNHGTIFLQI